MTELPGQLNMFTTTLEDRFAEFNENNPHVEQMILDIAGEMKARGFRHFGMKMIFERIRWLTALETVGEPWKINNDFTALYARKIMTEHKSFDGFFRTRKSRVDG